MTKAEIDRLEADARAKLEKISYRKEASESDYKEGEKTPYHASTETLEVLRPNRLHLVVDVHITYPDAVKAGLDYYHSDYIEIGDTTYLKEDKKPWKVSSEKQNVSDPMPLPGRTQKDVHEEYEYLYLGRENLNRSAADLYQVTTRTFIQNELVGLWVRKIWFDQQGRFLKIESDSTNYYSKESAKRIREYEYDVPIKIEAPADLGVPEGGFSNGRGTGNGGGTGQGVGTGSGGGMGRGSGSISGSVVDASPANVNVPPEGPAEIQPLKIIFKPRAQYTESARKENIQGTVTLRVQFLASGKIGTISVVKGLPNGLTEMAMDAARQITFEPQKRNGEPQSVTRIVEIPFAIY